jgi:hypothetical protein
MPMPFFSLVFAALRALAHSIPSMPLTSIPFYIAQQHAPASFNGMYNTPDFSRMSPVNDISSSFGTFGSCLTTPFDGLLLSPVNISIGGPNALGLSIGLVGSESSTYTQLLRQY